MSSTLADYRLEFEDLPLKIPQMSGGKDSKMSNKTTNVEAPKASRKYAKTRGEHFKDILIAVLVTSVVAFVAGSVYANGQHKATAQAVQQATAQAETVKK